MTTSNNQLSGWTEKRFEVLPWKKRSWPLFGGLLLVRSTTAFWILAKLLHMRSRLSKSIKGTKNCNACSQYWSTEWAQVSTTSPDRVTQLLQKLNELDYKVLPLPPYSPDLSPTNYHIFKHLNNFLQGKCFHNQQAAENAFQELVKSWSTDFYATGINKLISHWQICVDCNGSYFD